MGWTSTRLYGKTKDYFTENLTWEDDKKKTEVLAISVVKRSVVYAAVHVTPKDTNEPDYVYAAVILVKYAPKSDYNFHYKDMDETCGPYKAECPRKILELLSPLKRFVAPESDGFAWALEWRKKCWARFGVTENIK